MSQFPKGYVTIDIETNPPKSEFNSSEFDETLLKSIHAVAESIGDDNSPISLDNRAYSMQLLARLDIYALNNDDEDNIKQLNLLLNHKVAYVFDKESMDKASYKASIALMAAVTLVAVAGVAVLLIALPMITFITMLMFFNIRNRMKASDSKAVDVEAKKAWSTIGIITSATAGFLIAPVLFPIVAIMSATLLGVMYRAVKSIKYYKESIEFSAATAQLKSDIKGVTKIGMFGQSKAVDDDTAGSSLETGTGKDSGL
ncbi:MAG: hypothetical protein QNK11_00010 [Legionella sp.]|nr:hypothetical protein [Legionella sp.]